MPDGPPMLQMAQTTEPVRVAVIQIRLAPDDRAVIVAAAKRAGGTISKWMRRVLLEAANPSPEIVERDAMLAREKELVGLLGECLEWKAVDGIHAVGPFISIGGKLRRRVEEATRKNEAAPTDHVIEGVAPDSLFVPADAVTLEGLSRKLVQLSEGMVKAGDDSDIDSVAPTARADDQKECVTIVGDAVLSNVCQYCNGTGLEPYGGVCLGCGGTGKMDDDLVPGGGDGI